MMKYICVLLALAATSQVGLEQYLILILLGKIKIYLQAIECEECVSGMGAFPDALLAMGEELNETLHHHYCHHGEWGLRDRHVCG